MTAAARGASASGAAAAAAAAAARRIKIIREIITMFEPIQCPLCGKGKLLPMFSSSTTNWVCSQPECSYVVHQHGSRNSKIWKGEAAKEDGKSRGAWFETP